MEGRADCETETPESFHSSSLSAESKVCLKSKSKSIWQRGKMYIRSGMTPRANDMCLNPLQKSSPHQKSVGGRRGGSGTGRGKGGGGGELRSKKTVESSRHSSKNRLVGHSSSATSGAKSCHRQPMSLSPSSRRWRSADKLDLLPGNVHAIPVDMGGDPQTHSSLLASHDAMSIVHDDINSKNAAQVYSETHDHRFLNETRPRGHSDPLVFPLHHPHQELARSFSNTQHPSTSPDSSTIDAKRDGSDKSLRHSASLDSIEIAHQIVQSSTDSDSDTFSDVFRQLSPVLPMSLGCHPYVFPSEDVPAPLTLSLLQENIHITGEQETVSNNFDSKSLEESMAFVYNCVPSTQSPPAQAKHAWQVLNSSPTSASSTSAVPASPRRNERRHSSNIDFRAATSQIKPRPLPKSKSSWRLQAARARESVANLLSFTRAKEKDKTVGLENRKSALRYHSSTCLDDADTAIVNGVSWASTGRSGSYSAESGRAGQLSRSKNGHWSNPELVTPPSCMVYEAEISNISQISEISPMNVTNSDNVESLNSAIPSVEECMKNESVFNSGYDELTSLSADQVTSEQILLCSSPEQQQSETLDNDLPSAASLLNHHLLSTNRKRMVHHKSTRNLESVQIPDFSNSNLQRDQELSKSHGNLAIVACNEDDNCDNETKKRSVDAGPDEGDKKTVESPELSVYLTVPSTRRGSSGVGEEQDGQACPWMSSNLQRTLSAVPGHLKARGFYAQSSVPNTHVSSHDEEVTHIKEDQPMDFINNVVSDYANDKNATKISLVNSSSYDRLDSISQEIQKTISTEELSCVEYTSMTEATSQAHSDRLVEYSPHSDILVVTQTGNGGQNISVSPEMLGIPTKPQLYNRRARNSRSKLLGSELQNSSGGQRNAHVQLQCPTTLQPTDESLTGDNPSQCDSNLNENETSTMQCTMPSARRDECLAPSLSSGNFQDFHSHSDNSETKNTDDSVVSSKSLTMENLDKTFSSSLSHIPQDDCHFLGSRDRSDSMSSLTSELSNLSTRSEARGIRESSRRVEDLLSNQLFKKHLVRHADSIERNVFRTHKRTFRKSVSQFDLSSAQTVHSNHVMSHLLNNGDINNNEGQSPVTASKWTNDGDPYNTSLTRSMSMSEWCSPPSVTSVFEDDDGHVTDNVRRRSNRQLKKAATTFSLTTSPESDSSSDATHSETRRKSVSCERSSLHRSEAATPDEREEHGAILNHRQRRLYIPSFKEFRKQRSHAQLTTHFNDVIHTSDIYIIDEVENDENTMKIKERMKTVQINIGETDIKTDSVFRSRNDDIASSRKSARPNAGKDKNNPVFLHPAITVTSNDVFDDVGSTHQRRLLLNRSKSESNMKREKSPPPGSTSPEGKIYSPLLSVQYSVSAECLSPRTTVDRQEKREISEISNTNSHPTQTETNIESSAVETENERLSNSTTTKVRDANEKSDIVGDTLETSASMSRTLKSQSNGDNKFGASVENLKPKAIPDLQMDNVQTYSDDDHDLDSDHFKNVLKEDGFSLYRQTPLRQSPSTEEKAVDSDDQNFKQVRAVPFQAESGQNLIESLGFTFRTEVKLNTIAESVNQVGEHFNESKVTSGSVSSQNDADFLENERSVELDNDEITRAKYSNSHYEERAGENAELSALINEARDDAFTRSSDVMFQRRSPSSSSSDSDQSTKTAVLRSTSDVSTLGTDEREKRRRERKDRPYKSDPFTGTNKLPQHSLHPETNLYKFPSVSTTCSFPSLEELVEYSDSASYVDDGEDEERRKRRNRLSNISTASEDSGVVGLPRLEADGTAVKTPTACSHCASYSKDGPHESLARVPHSVSDSALASLTVCKKCSTRVRERKETIQEIAESEKRYGRDLCVLKEEFYRPMKATSLLTLDQLDTIFINFEELIHVHKQFMSKLTSALISAVKAGDEELSTINIENIFNQSSTMFLAFENYCIHQAKAGCLLEQLEKEKELLHVFLEVAQNQNPKLRRMHLKSFLMMPVQRIMRYPLLLGRLYKVTPFYHEDKENIKQAQENIENILHHINAKTQIATGVRSKHLETHGYSLSDKIEVNRVALEVLGWTKKDVCDVLTSRLWYGQVPDPSWATKRARNVKFNMVHAVLLTHGRPVECPTHMPLSPRDVSPVMQVAMVLVRERGGRYQIVRDPLLMDRCVVTVDPEYDHVFEIHEQGRETYLFKAERSKETGIWIRHLKQLSGNLGYWRRRRNGLPNIMLKISG